MTKYQLQAILELPVPERLQVAEAIWNSLEDGDQQHIPVSASRQELLDERLAAFQADPEDTLTWPELKARLKQRL